MRSIKEKREIQTTLRILIAEGLSELEQYERVNEEHPKAKVSLRELRSHVSEIMTAEIDATQGISPQEAFVRLRLRQGSVIRDLDVIIERVKENPKAGPGQMTAAVNALKAKADILSNVFKVSKDLGIVKPMKEDQLVIGGVTVGDLTVKELKDAVTSRLDELREIASTKGFVDFLDVSPEDDDVYYSIEPAKSLPPKAESLDTNPPSKENESRPIKRMPLILEEKEIGTQ